MPWSDFIGECLWYIGFALVFHLYLYGLGMVFLTLGAVFLKFLPGKRHVKYPMRLAQWGLCVTIFLLVGAFFNGLWSCSIYGRFYHSSDYVCGFIPFWPPTEAWFEPRDTGGVDPMPVLRVFWLIFTVSTWVVTIGVYRFLVKCLGLGKKEAGASQFLAS